MARIHSPWGSQRVGHDWVTSTSMFYLVLLGTVLGNLVQKWFPLYWIVYFFSPIDVTFSFDKGFDCSPARWNSLQTQFPHLVISSLLLILLTIILLASCPPLTWHLPSNLHHCLPRCYVAVFNRKIFITFVLFIIFFSDFYFYANSFLCLWFFSVFDGAFLHLSIL